MDRFDVIERIDLEVTGGTLGEVWRAHDRQTDQMVTLRLVDEPDATRAALLVETARRAAAIRDPRVMAVLDAGIDAGRVWVAMELVDGRTLAKVLEEEGPFTPERLVSVACELCAALDAGHRWGLVHRDLNPDSVMLTAGGIKVMDFGMSHARLSRATGRYASPETRFGYPVDERADLYSLGVLLVELATGIEFCHDDEDEAPIVVGASMPPAVTAVLLRLLHKDAGSRFRNATAVAEALRRAVPLVSPVLETRRRRRRGALIGGALAVAGMIGVLLIARGRVGGISTAASAGCEISFGR